MCAGICAVAHPRLGAVNAVVEREEEAVLRDAEDGHRFPLARKGAQLPQTVGGAVGRPELAVEEEEDRSAGNSEDA